MSGRRTSAKPKPEDPKEKSAPSDHESECGGAASEIQALKDAPSETPPTPVPQRTSSVCASAERDASANNTKNNEPTTPKPQAGRATTTTMSTSTSTKPTNTPSATQSAARGASRASIRPVSNNILPRGEIPASSAYAGGLTPDRKILRPRGMDPLIGLKNNYSGRRAIMEKNTHPEALHTETWHLLMAGVQSNLTIARDWVVNPDGVNIIDELAAYTAKNNYELPDELLDKYTSAVWDKRLHLAGYFDPTAIHAPRVAPVSVVHDDSGLVKAPAIEAPPAVHEQVDGVVEEKDVLMEDVLSPSQSEVSGGGARGEGDEGGNEERIPPPMLSKLAGQTHVREPDIQALTAPEDPKEKSARSDHESECDGAASEIQALKDDAPSETPPTPVPQRTRLHLAGYFDPTAIHAPPVAPVSVVHDDAGLVKAPAFEAPPAVHEQADGVVEEKDVLMEDVLSPSQERGQTHVREPDIQALTAVENANAASGTGALRQYSIYARSEIHYDKKDLLGQGCVGAVYRATVHDTDIAIKVVNKDIDHYEVTKMAVLQDSMNHNNILKFLGMCPCNPYDDHDILLFELMRCNLTMILHSDRAQLRPRGKLQFSADMLRGLLHLHSHSVAHGNLKSENCLIAENFTLKICDFDTGLPRFKAFYARIASDAEWKGAREVLTDGQFSIQSDMFDAGNLAPDPAFNSLLKYCFHENPSARPTCQDTLRIIESLLKKEGPNSPGPTWS
ncbi:Protein tyrosine and serine/threonine kinase [Pelomyxa schiedti]|nr:Protein tyrosine and serine/threonine kinase [Pelomyxa schiedti]